MQDEEIALGDVVQMRKPHPCGSLTWVITRTGADIKMRCQKCGHVVMLDRIIFFRRLKKILIHASETIKPQNADKEQ